MHVRSYRFQHRLEISAGFSRNGMIVEYRTEGEGEGVEGGSAFSLLSNTLYMIKSPQLDVWAWSYAPTPNQPTPPSGPAYTDTAHGSRVSTRWIIVVEFTLCVDVVDKTMERNKGYDINKMWFTWEQTPKMILCMTFAQSMLVMISMKCCYRFQHIDSKLWY